MKILLVFPETPTTFWSFRHALKFISKKSSEPPLGLLTIAAMLPDEWDIKLVDMNVSALTDEQIQWADYVFLSGMNVHMQSMKEVIQRSKQLGAKVVAGGPLITTDPQEFEGIDHLFLNEAERTLPQFIEDLQNGHPKPVYNSDKFPDLALTPNPRWDLLDMKKYSAMSIQYSRGCPYNCDFCSITLLNGRIPRTKNADQFITELEAIYQLGWRGSVFIVDDNFIGNRKRLKKDLLPALVKWSQDKKYPFNFMTEVSINLSDDDELVDLMVKAGFNSAFVGIETTNDQSLDECGKSHNRNRDLVASVQKLQNRGLMIAGGFIVGFDNDPPNIFKQQIQFIQSSGIVTAMVGMLNAPSGTRLFQRMKSENRLLSIMSGDNTDGSTNFIPKMGYEKLREGYRELIHTIYSQKAYYERVKVFLQNYQAPINKPVRIAASEIKALFKSLWTLGIREKGKRFYWKLLIFSLLRQPRKFPLAVRMAIYGFHFRRIAETI